MAMSLSGSKPKASGKSTKEGNNKLGHGADLDYIPPEGGEILSSCSDNDESSRSQAVKVIFAHDYSYSKSYGSRKKRGTSTTQALRKSQRIQKEGGSPNGATSSRSTEPTANHAKGMSVMVAQPSELPTSPTDETNQHSRLPNVGSSTVVIMSVYAGRVFDLMLQFETLGGGDIDFGIKESIILRVGQTFGLGDYKNDMVLRRIIDVKCQALYRDWKCRLHDHYKVIKKEVSDPKTIHYIPAEIAKKISEQSQPGVTNPQSGVQVSIDVLGKRSDYLKGYGIHKRTYATHSQVVPNSEVVALKEVMADQAKLLADYAKKFETMMLFMATKNGVDPATILGLISSNENGEDTSIGQEDGIST
ncbi:hypothetical protein RHSIM_Rhsim08G0110800 [Rhododendron simsii]|uniref:Uncharacterized protein n=1 Tax=Rhododendron simsii TaxID=118357 RepID=A0A834GGH8_RHOSS|nr:hypothetical protein RHSIM_Rhsim08G0110800 [Rhododendron simsii]